MKKLSLSEESRQGLRSLWLKNIILRLLILNIGFLFITLGIVMIVNSRLGANSWNVLHVGLSIVTPLSLGQAIQVTSLTLITINWLMKESPGVAAFLELIVVGILIDVFIPAGVFPLQTSLIISFLYVLFGTLSLGFGIALYIKSNLGKGAREGTMFVLARHLPWRLGTVRTILEVLALLTGYLLKGPVGVGTVFVTFALGWVIEYSMSLLKNFNVANITGQSGKRG